ncbi:MAG: FAD-dependent thymidylate synthase [Rhodospirillales bacterium]
MPAVEGFVTEPSLRVVGVSSPDPAVLAEWGDEFCPDAKGDAESTFSRMLGLADTISPSEMLVEFGGRQCYRSFRKGRDSRAYLRNIIDSGHGSVLEHVSLNIAMAGVSRSFSLELIRHRAGTGISQESQRYVPAREVRFVVPPLMVQRFEADAAYREARIKERDTVIEAYIRAQEIATEEVEKLDIDGTDRKKRVNEAARAVLPNEAETRMLWTGNLRALRHIIALRGAIGADLEMRRWAKVLLDVVTPYAPNIFEDFEVGTAPDGFPVVCCESWKV